VTWGSNTQSSVIDVTYFIGAGFNANEVALINSAASQWSQAGSSVRLVEVGSAAGANIRLTMANLGNTGHLSNATFPAPGARITVPQSGTLNGQPWAMIQGPENFTVNSFYSFWDGTGAQGASFDFQAEILDLMGHGIGLGFVTAGTQPTSVMQPTFTAGVPGNHSLSPSDIAAVQALYGAPEPATLALFGVGLSLVGFSRRRRSSNPSA
jgi:hypothetical protein